MRMIVHYINAHKSEVMMWRKKRWVVRYPVKSL